MAMSRFFAIAIALCAFTTGLFAHDVVYQSALKYYIQHQGSTPPALGYLLQFEFRKEAIPVSSLDSGEISVVHLDGEHCLVTATVTSSDPLLVSVTALTPVPLTVPPTGLLDVRFGLQLLRDPGSTSSVFITGDWSATHGVETGFPPDTGCNGTGKIKAEVKVYGPIQAPQLTFINIPFDLPSGEPVSTATGELFGYDERADLSLGLGGPLPLSFQRYYGSYLSLNGVSSALGTNWMHNFDLTLSASVTSAGVTLFRGKTVSFTRPGSA